MQHGQRCFSVQHGPGASAQLKSVAQYSMGSRVPPPHGSIGRRPLFHYNWCSRAPEHAAVCRSAMGLPWWLLAHLSFRFDFQSASCVCSAHGHFIPAWRQTSWHDATQKQPPRAAVEQGFPHTALRTSHPCKSQTAYTSPCFTCALLLPPPPRTLARASMGWCTSMTTRPCRQLWAPVHQIARPGS